MWVSVPNRGSAVQLVVGLGDHRVWSPREVVAVLATEDMREQHSDATRTGASRFPPRLGTFSRTACG